MKFRKGPLFFGLIACLVSFNAFSQQAGSPNQPKPKPLFSREKETEPKSNMSVQPMYQFYFLNDSDNFDKIFHQTYLTPFMLSLGSYPIRNLSVNLNAGYAQAKGTAVAEGGTESSGETVKLTVIPVQLEVTYRFDYFDEQLLVPVVGLGGDYWYYKEDNQYSKDVEGFKGGWHATAGVGILLDRLDPTSRIALKEYGIENVVLEIEGRYCSMETKGLNLSGIGASVGLLIEF
jgi:hypothetical protein